MKFLKSFKAVLFSLLFMLFFSTGAHAEAVDLTAVTTAVNDSLDAIKPVLIAVGGGIMGLRLIPFAYRWVSKMLGS